ncbi:uncharacterized protein [Palaemon carinicauda]|uniref:uncharacterized protein n=1 Tax=Palaemon carinicauda TaxID=392227 RepID=UPI0035B5B4DE
MCELLSVAKKCVSKPSLGLLASPVTNILYLHDAGTGVQFLVETGACHFLLPKPGFKTRCSLTNSAYIPLVSANGSAIASNCYETLILSFRSTKYIWNFLVADVPIPILDADFLSHFHLLVDVLHQWIVNTDLHSSTPLKPVPPTTLHISKPTDAYIHLLTSDPEVFRQELRQTPTVPAKHGIYPHMKMMGPTLFSRFRRLAVDRLAVSKQTLAKIEEWAFAKRHQADGRHPYTSS